MATVYFHNPEFLLLLLLLPLLVMTHQALFKFTKRKGMMFANFSTLKRVTGEKLLTRNIGLLVLRLLTLTLIVLALAGTEYRYIGDAKESDFVLAIDTSGSMTAADLQPSRIEAAKEAATWFVDSLQATAYIGVLSFAGNVEIEQMLTEDRVAVKQALDRVNARTVSGTDISGAIITGTNMLHGSERGKVIIMLTDGSVTVAASEEDPVQRAVNYAKAHHVTIHTIGLGSPVGSLIGYLPSIYNLTAVYDAEMIEFIASETGGRAVHAQDEVALAAAYEALIGDVNSRLQNAPLHFHFLMLSLLLLFVEWGLMNTRYRLIP
jgi:Ca-activated chloride channel homolog